MPTLEFKGKPFIYSHHLSVPFRELVIDSKKSLPGGKKASLDDNLIIHGDNLEALKALLPRYAGKVDVIYIDPPYNTGNERWAYNDNVNSPLMKEWLGKVVDRDDLERHDKWLCMMWPRLQLLRELLAESGVIWINIDDNEVHHARVIMNEIFGGDAFVAACIWQKIFSPKNTAQFFSEDHDYLLVYAKDSELWRPRLLPRTEAMAARYRNPDNDPRGPWTSGDISARNYYSEGTYPVRTPSGREIAGPPKGTYWRVNKAKFDKLDKDGRIWWGEDGGNVPRLKRFLTDVKEGKVPQTIWLHSEVGNTQEAKKELLSIIHFESSDDVFITPKPTRLLARVLELSTQSGLHPVPKTPS
jgi:adenine-specific DNA-methyltransferase